MFWCRDIGFSEIAGTTFDNARAGSLVLFLPPHDPTTAACLISAFLWRSHLIIRVLPSSSMNSLFPSFIPATEQDPPDRLGDSDGPSCTTGRPTTSPQLSCIIGRRPSLRTTKTHWSLFAASLTGTLTRWGLSNSLQQLSCKSDACLKMEYQRLINGPFQLLIIGSLPAILILLSSCIRTSFTESQIIFFETRPRVD